MLVNKVHIYVKYMLSSEGNDKFIGFKMMYMFFCERQY